MAISQAADGARHTHTHRDRERETERHTEKSRKARRRAAAAPPRGSSASASSLDDEEKLAHSRGEEKVTVAGAVVAPDLGRGRGLEPDAGAEELDAASLRRRRLDRLEGQHRRHRQLSSEEEDVFVSTPTLTRTMTTESHATRSSRRDATGSSASEGHKRRGHRDEEKRHRRKKRDGEGEDAPAQYVYGAPTEKAKSATTTVRVSETRRLGRDGESEEEETVSRSRTVKDKPREKKIKVIYVTRDELKTSKHKEPRVKTVKEDRPRESESSVHRSRTHQSRRKSVVESLPPSPPRRHTSSRILHSEARPALKRSNTTSSHVPSTRSHIPSTAGTSLTAKRSSFMGSFFGPGIQQHHHEPEKLVECLTCLSDDIPRSKSAKLKCGHRMCHSCLKRIFRLSVNDPQHMPPKCCTADHIPLKHVEKLFDINFKKNWNRKFQEFSTKNRIYCPARRCGEWIKPGNMHNEDGRKYGKCGRCKTKVCCLCNGKWHGAKDCPKDEETNRLLETAKQAGWQRCYNCRTMVELKEGCNHMTCRCTAEFCMICGLKWKSCNCPWFNYEAVEEDRLNHMQIPREMPIPLDGNLPPNLDGDRPRRIRRPRPATYNEELTERQRQERRDEALARRMQRATLNNEPDINIDDDYQGGIGDIHGVGNGAAHFMNQDYVRAAHNILTGNFDQANAAANYVMGVANARAPRRNMNERYPVPGPVPGGGGSGGGRARPPPPPPPVLRRHTMREQAYNDALPRSRAAERIVPRRSRTDYEAEAAVHAPLGRSPLRPGQAPPQPAPRVERVGRGAGSGDRERERGAREPRPSVLAGLGGRGNRVSAWRSHVEPGVEPEEGVLSMVS
ncbi:hypothetical protein DL98DRAFT_246512 [Cadophora sp. DSE1049]|nr:hypothetical protein DL98DRAFT_246512 [Cadophora sp. DSE1049]